MRLSVLLYNLAMLHQSQGNYATAVPLLEEVVALDQRTGHADLEADRAALEAARRRAAGAPEPTLRDAIEEWRAGPHDEQDLAAVINLACNQAIAAIRAGTTTAREALAQDLALLRAAHPLPLAGANDFLHVLQLWLRDEPGMAEHAARLRAALPAQLAQALAAIERLIAGEAIEAQDAGEPEL